MAAANRKAPRLGDAKFLLTDTRTVSASVIVYAGEMVGQDSSFEVAAADNNAGTVCLGVSTKKVDNTDDGEYLDFISQAVHGMDQNGNITKAHIGDMAYVLDAASVEISGTTAVGPIVEVDSSFVYVDFDPANRNI